MNTINVLLAEDHMIVREGLRALLDSEKDIEVVGEAENGHQAVEMTRRLSPAVVVMDIAMPLLNGLEATRQILRIAPTVKVLILSAHSDDAYVEHVMELGAAGYLIKQTAAEVLPKAIREVCKGKTFFSPAISKRLHHHQKQAMDRGEPGAKKGPLQLTSREVEVLQLVAEGKANKQTADELHISIKTVEKHRQSLMEKLNIHDTAGLTRHAIAAGIIESSVQSTTI
jgi:DNA-binding NarL/FixJ family response regulator